eukprot:2101506-Rhodomonas_salina.1
MVAPRKQTTYNTAGLDSSLALSQASGQRQISQSNLARLKPCTARDRFCRTTGLDTSPALSQASGQRQILQNNQARLKPSTVSGLGPETDFAEQQG